MTSTHPATGQPQPSHDDPEATPIRSVFGGKDPLAKHRAIVGRDARTPWYVRVRALIVLILFVVVLGAAIAGFTLLLLASGRIVLETLAG